MRIEFSLDPALTNDLREQIINLWADVTNAGGAVGFVAPATPDAIRPTAEQAFDGITAGIDHLLIGTDGDRLVALLFIVDNRFDLKAHWRVLKRVMVTPHSQGRGYGAALMREAHTIGHQAGWAGFQVTVRAGAGTEDFYARLGYREVGRMPGALRIGPGDDRDEILMWRELAG